MKAPIIELIENARAKFFAEAGFPPERLHVSLAMEGALTRWYASTLVKSNIPKFGPHEMEVLGMEVVRSTKNTPHIEFWLSATRGGQVISVHALVEPESIGERREVNRNAIRLETDYEEGVRLEGGEDSGEA